MDQNRNYFKTEMTSKQKLLNNNISGCMCAKAYGNACLRVGTHVNYDVLIPNRND